MQRRLGLDLEVPRDFGVGLAWFSAGEASFVAKIVRGRRHGYKWLYLRYAISLRADDRLALEYIRDTLAVGRIHIKRAGGGNPNPMVSYEVGRSADLYHVIVPLFEKYPIPAQFKKARDFEIWKELVEIHYHQGGPQRLGMGPGRKQLGSTSLPQTYWDKIEPLVEQLKAAREFHP